MATAKKLPSGSWRCLIFGGNDKNRQYVIKSPKSYADDRFIQFPDFVASHFKQKSGRVTELNPNMITSRFEHVLKQAGVPHFRFHDCRHYCASILHALGVPDAYVMEHGGWVSDTTLKNVYRHTLEDQKGKMNQKANSYFESMRHEMQYTKKPSIY